MLGRVFLGRYETIRLLGEGGMGRVYLARQLDLDRQVVVKVMHDHIAADATFRERFEREMQLMARFQHPYAVTLYDASLKDPQGPCIVMEYIRGVTLDTLLHNNHRLDPVRVGRLLHQLCEVLQAAHAEGIVHRDLKPANLMVVDADTPYEMIKVMDFGLAKRHGPGKVAAVTNHEFAVGTPGYMCPEQARGEEMDHRGDLYSVGVILFELLTGQLPFAGRSTMDLLLAHATEEPPSFAALGVLGLVPAGIERAVQQCLAKDPEQRPGCARELAQNYASALANHQTGTTSPPPRAPRPRPTRTPSPPLPAPHPAPVSASHPAPPEPVLVKATATAPVPTTDPLALVHHLEAWMPEVIATHKLRGFIQDVGGELIESVPGRITVRLGGKNSAYEAPSRGLAWLGLGRRPAIDVELRLQRGDAGRDNQLRITVIFRAGSADLNTDSAWRSVCSRIYCDLRAYLMGQSAALADGAS
jgi:serine/threonine-protein kinase